MSKEKTVDVNAITSNLIRNAEKLRYGTAAVTLKIHDGTIVAVSHETTEITKEKEAVK